MDYKDMKKITGQLEEIYDSLDSTNTQIKNHFNLELNGIMNGKTFGHKLYQSNEYAIKQIDKICDEIQLLHRAYSNKDWKENILPNKVKEWESNDAIDYSDTTKESAVVIKQSDYVGENVIARYNSELELPPNSTWRQLVNYKLYAVDKNFYNKKYTKRLGCHVKSFIHGIGENTFISYEKPSVDIYMFNISNKGTSDIKIEYDIVRKIMRLRNGLKTLDNNYSPTKEDIEKIKKLLVSIERELDLYEEEIEVIKEVFGLR